MTVKELFDIASSNCIHRQKALQILRMKGVTKAVEYLNSHGGNVEVLKILESVETKDPHYRL